MKLILMGAALALASAAAAQTGDTEVSTTTAPAAGATVAPDNSNPERDARGIPVVSAPATAPAGYNQAPQMVPAGTPMPTVAPPAPTSAGDLPPCTRTLTDRCTQTYERGRAPR